jgi:ElaB/YqjD/DUF883 family membrane-anchored ribosome-binding protein
MTNPNGTQTEERDLAHMLTSAREQIEDVADRAKRTLDRADKTLAEKMQENPILVLGIAVGVGYVIGRVFSRLS